MPEFNSFHLDFLLRLLVAGFLGGTVGLERELRAKDAGLRTHFLVALGSSLLMIISVYGFQGLEGISGIRGGDPSRIAAGIVSGIGFIGAGAIMVHRRYVQGLTTAAGLLVVAGVGMACGAGHYVLAFAATVLALIGLELFRIVANVVHLVDHDITVSVRDTDLIPPVIDKLKETGLQVISFNVKSEPAHNRFRVAMAVRARVKLKFAEEVIRALNQVGGVSIISIE